jgi:serine protease Do
MSFKGTTAPPQPHQKLRSKERSGATPFGLPDIRSLIKKVNQSVVAIRMLDSDDSWSLSSLGLKKGDDSKPTGYGAGFIVSPDGHIITNEHVLKSGAKIEVELLGGEKYKGRSIQTDKKNDLALIKIDCDRKLKPVALGNSRSVEIGEWVVGIGNPYGIGQSIMVGVVSAKSRKIPGSGYPPLIQIDAAMNLGNSGGPLFNMAGEVIGVNTILLWKSQGIGFATPSNVAVKFMRMASSSGAIRSASAMRSPGPRGPTTDRPRRVGGAFNALDPPWKRGN